MNVAQETLGLRRQGLSPCLSLLMSAFALPIPPAALTGHLRRLTERSPTRHVLPSIHSMHPRGSIRSFGDALTALARRQAYKWIQVEYVNPKLRLLA